YGSDANFAGSTSTGLAQSISTAPTALVLSSNRSSAILGQGVTLTGTITSTATGAGTPTGMVTFTIDGVAQAPVAVVAGVATLAPTALAVGTHTVTASFADGSGNFAAGNATLAGGQQI